MKAPLLSILIPTIPDRKDFLARLMKDLEPQKTAEVEILVDCDKAQRDGGPPTGERRTKLVHACRGEFLMFVDDDDLIATDAVARITAAIKENPNVDVIGFEGRMCVDGNMAAVRPFYHSCRFDWREKNGVYYRPPNHLNPVRREIVLKVMPFLPVTFGEDRDYAKRLRPHLGVEREHWLEGGPVYLYLYRSRKTEMSR